MTASLRKYHNLMEILSQGFRPAQVYACDFIVDNSQMGFIISDKEQNIVVYKYQPEARESLGGKKVLCDFVKIKRFTNFGQL